MMKRVEKKRPWVSFMIIVVYCICSWIQLLESACVPRNGCDTALAYYTVQRGEDLAGLARRFQTTIADLKVFNAIGSENVVLTGDYLYFPFSCECVQGVLSHVFTYQVQYDDTYNRIANNYFEGLSKPDWITQASGITPDTVIDLGTSLQVPVNCSCGNPAYRDYGLFATFPAFSSDNASDLASKFSISESLLQSFNPSVDLNGTLSDGDILFFPVKENGAYRPYYFGNDGSSSNNQALIIGVSVGGGVAALLLILALCLCYTCLSRKKRPRKGMHDDLEKVQLGSGVSGERASEIKSPLRGTQGSSHASSALSDFTVDKSVEFSFEELAAATNNFNVANKIGEGGYGSVYLATLRGQKLAVKRMNLQATREFMAELQVLTHVHHTNLVQLIGYCTVDSLFLIYEYVENGTLDRHLHGSHNLPPLSWQARVQIALDAARGLEYIHEHTKPTYIHRDVKSSNILIDKQLHAKVADFGLTKLTESGAGSVSLTGPTRLVGTFGYMSPEYARFGDVSPKVDVYSFGVVLFEIISAKAAIVRSTGSSTDPAGTHKEEQRGLVTLFEEVLTHPEGKENLGRLIDPALNGNYPLEAAWKMTQLAGACTQENPELRPSMRTAVVALMTLSSTSQDWEMSAFGSDTVITGLISGR